MPSNYMEYNLPDGHTITAVQILQAEDTRHTASSFTF